MIKYAYVTDVGLSRALNEDSFCFQNAVFGGCNKKGYGFSLFNTFKAAVFDGVGGKNKGEVASLFCANFFKKNFTVASMKDRADVYRFVQSAHDGLIDIQTQENSDMMTTFVGVAVQKKQLLFMNIGDSQAFYYRNGEMKRLSYDDTYLNELKKRRGKITDEEREQYEHVITNCFGLPGFQNEKTHCYFEPRKKNSYLYLLSDGVSDLMEAKELQTITDEQKDPKKILDCVETKIRERGAHDNYTLIVIQL